MPKQNHSVFDKENLRTKISYYENKTNEFGKPPIIYKVAKQELNSMKTTSHNKFLTR